tara:strand:+ start:4080 stop:4799 length:720 start_codon:yes stop_codon:yes gene_type:complete
MLLSLVSCITTKDLEYIGSDMEINKIQPAFNDYKLQSGDLLSIQISTTTEQLYDFFNKENTSNSQLMVQNPYLYGYAINEEGNLELPTFGIVKAAGFTVDEITKIIQNIAVSYFENPVVKLNIINFDITILGEVNKAGTFKIVDPKVNILYALSLAGDITKYGNRKKVKVIRNENNINNVFYVDLTKSDILNNEKFFLKPHDIIYVSPLKKKFYAFDNITNILSVSISAVTLFLLVTQN